MSYHQNMREKQNTMQIRTYATDALGGAKTSQCPTGFSNPELSAGRVEPHLVFEGLHIHNDSSNCPAWVKNEAMEHDIARQATLQINPLRNDIVPKHPPAPPVHVGEVVAERGMAIHVRHFHLDLVSSV